MPLLVELNKIILVWGWVRFLWDGIVCIANEVHIKGWVVFPVASQFPGIILHPFDIFLGHSLISLLYICEQERSGGIGGSFSVIAPAFP